jgi:hypothetical protein
MNDKSLDIFLMVLFGAGGITILIVAWAQPMPVLERVLTTSIGLIGPFWVLSRALSLTSVLARIGIRKNLAEAEMKKKPH